MADVEPCNPGFGCDSEDAQDCDCADCTPQPGSQLMGDPDADDDACRTPEWSRNERLGAKCLRLQLASGQPDRQDGNQQRLNRIDPATPEISYRLYSDAEYRPCDVSRGDSRVCDLLQGGLTVDNAQDCARLCTCMRSLPNVYCNAVAWVWGGAGGQRGNCFPKFIEGVAQSRLRCARSSAAGELVQSMLRVFAGLHHEQAQMYMS